VKGKKGKGLKETGDDLGIIEGLEKAKTEKTEKGIIKLIEEYNLSREMIPTEFLNKESVQMAMLPKMPMTALIRNLGNLGRSGLLKQGNFDVIETVVNKITSEKALQRARIHPIAILSALNVYTAGVGVMGSRYRGKGSGSTGWEVVGDIKDALDKAFYASFKFVEPTGKRIYLATDVSGSMTWENVNGIPGMMAMTAAAAMAMVTYKVEKKVIMKGFSHNLVDLNLSRANTLESVINRMQRIPMGGTDCSQPMLDAIRNNLEVDAFIVYTDSETWAGGQHPVEALRKYRNKSGIDAKLIVVAFASNGFSIADPSDEGMLDLVGFDSSAPQIMSRFMAGEF
jgi:60 kDa SS-A/Ro ribonucleoprotein